MKSTPVVLVDDPAANRGFDLQRALARGAGGALAAILEPAPLDLHTFVEPEVAAASAITAGAPVPMRSYHVRAAESPAARAQQRAAPTLSALSLREALDRMLELVPRPGLVVVFVSLATLPFIEYLHADPRTRPLLKVGITDARLDAAFTLAEKLIDDKKLAYHEYTASLERVLQSRLESMLQEHARRAPTGG